MQEWLETHYNRPVNIGELAVTFGLSRRVLERRFKAATGETPLLYLQRTRVEAVKGMLEDNAGSFSEIAFRVSRSERASGWSICLSRLKPLERESEQNCSIT